MNRLLVNLIGAIMVLAAGAIVYIMTTNLLSVAATLLLACVLLMQLLPDHVSSYLPSGDPLPDDWSLIDLSYLKLRHVVSVGLPLIILWLVSAGNYGTAVFLTVVGLVCFGFSQAYNRGMLKLADWNA